MTSIEQELKLMQGDYQSAKQKFNNLEKPNELEPIVIKLKKNLDSAQNCFSYDSNLFEHHRTQFYNERNKFTNVWLELNLN